MWKKEFVDLLYPTDRSKVNIEQAMRLKYKNIPTSLFKYNSFDEKGYSIAILQKDKIRLNIPGKFNDLYDSSITFTIDCFGHVGFPKYLEDFIISEFSESEVEELRKSDNLMFELGKLIVGKDKAPLFVNMCSESIENENNEMVSMFNSCLKTDMYITCFSEHKDSILMWGYYADSNRGFCIEYDFSSLDFHDFRTRLLYPVIYKDSLFDATEYLRPVFEKRGTYNNLIVTYAAITKSTKWDHENEWRYCLPLGPSNDPQFLLVPKPKAIYLGVKVSNENKENIIKLATKRGIKVYKMAMNPSGFNLITKELL